MSCLAVRARRPDAVPAGPERRGRRGAPPPSPHGALLQPGPADRLAAAAAPASGKSRGQAKGDIYAPCSQSIEHRISYTYMYIYPTGAALPAAEWRVQHPGRPLQPRRPSVTFGELRVRHPTHPHSRTQPRARPPHTRAAATHAPAVLSDHECHELCSLFECFNLERSDWRASVVLSRDCSRLQVLCASQT